VQLVYIPTALNTPIAGRPRVAIAKRQIEEHFDRLGQCAFTKKDLGEIFNEQRNRWRLSTAMRLTDFIDYLAAKSHLTEVALTPTFEEYSRKLVRFTWRDCSPLELACTIRGGAYLSHATAVFVHDLNDQPSTTVFVNREQSPKPPPRSALTQEALDRAFAGDKKQRTSSLAYTDGRNRFVVLAGKDTRDAGVVDAVDPYGGRIRVTNIERTLVDIAVRPAYAGGVERVLEAYRGAVDVASIAELVALLKRVGHVYPYHQCIGYYADRAGFPPDLLGKLRSIGLDFDFYLAHGIASPHYVEKWRLYVPQHLEN